LQFNIAQFRASGLVDAGARPSLFEVTFPIVGTINQLQPLKDSLQTNRQKISFLCTAASLPAYRIDAIPVYYFGRPIYFQGERTFEPWMVTILNDEDFALRDFFESWSNKMNSIVGNLAETSDPRNYKADSVLVTQYGKDGAVLRAYEFAGMWPSIVGDIALSWDQGNRIETFDCRLVYDWAEPARPTTTDVVQASPASYDVGADDNAGLNARVLP